VALGIRLALWAAIAARQSASAAAGGDGIRLLILDSDAVRLEVDGQRGAIVRLLDKAKNVDLRPPPALTESFRLSLPVPGARRNYVFGKDQVLTAGTVTSGKLVLRWDGPLVDQGGASTRSPPR